MDAIFKRLYEDNISGKLSDERFQKLSADYEKEERDLKVLTKRSWRKANRRMLIVFSPLWRGTRISAFDPVPGDRAKPAVCGGGALCRAHDPFVFVYGEGPDPGDLKLYGGTKMKHKFFAALAVILGFSAVMSLISAKNYAASLNKVVLTDTHTGVLRTKTETAGWLHFAASETVELPEGCEVEAVLVSQGASVKAGQALVQLRQEDLQLCSLQLQLEREQLSARQGGSAIEQEIAALKIRALDGRLARLEELIAADGVLTSPVSGRVVSLPVSGGAVEIGVYDQGFYCTWEVPQNENRDFTVFSGTVGQKEEALTVDTVGYDAASAVYQYRSTRFSVGTDINIMLPVQISMTYESQKYGAVLPSRCIWTDSDGSDFVYVVGERTKVYGKELYLRKKGVTILERNDQYAAVMEKLENVVEYAARTPVDLEAVRVLK